MVEATDECRALTTAATSLPTANVCVEIRGGIKDYSATIVNYRVEVFLLN